MKNFLDRASDYKPSTNNFKFYVSASQELQVETVEDTDLNKSEDDVSFQKSKPKLLDGEIIIAEGNRVLYFPNVADKTKGLSGNLHVTNFRFIFDAYESDNLNEEVSMHQTNQLLGDHSSCLTNIQSLYHLCGEKKKKLFHDSQLTERIKGLQIVCKNFKVFTFTFDQSPITQGRNIAKTLLHHAHPGRHQLLFAYDFSSKSVSSEKCAEAGVVLFSTKSEWENELIRTCSASASNWRISTQNQKFLMSTSLPQWLIVPHSLLDCDLVTASHSFRCNRPPVWTWSSPNGAAIIRTADLLPTITDRTQENRMLENVRKCHPQLKGPCIKYLDKDLPSVRELFQCYTKLKDLCIPDSYRQFKLQDSHLYSALENTKWLHHVSSCLKVVVDAVNEIQRGTTVVLQESDGRDTSALISSLVQLVMDSHSRSVVGFQSLIQKEWVALGHPFCKRLGLLRANNSEQSPVFLLFLDCVWQLQNQFPSSFEFTETYLTTLWDSVHVSVFDTFLFDCEKDRVDAVMSQSEKLQLRSVWNWSFQFSDGDVELFFNPLYKLGRLKEFSLGEKDGSRESDSAILPEYSLPYLGLWMQCYFRWLPLLSIRSGGRPQVDIVHRQLMKDIQSLLTDIREHSKKKSGDSVFDSINNLNSIGNRKSSSSNNNNNNNNNNNKNNNNSGSNFRNGKKINLICSITSSCGKNASESGEENFDSRGPTETESEHQGQDAAAKDAATLFQKRGLIDNFFPFTVGGTAGFSLSGVPANSGNLSDLDTPSVYSLTD